MQASANMRLAVRISAVTLLGLDLGALAWSGAFLVGPAARPDTSFLPVQEYARVFLGVTAILALFCILALIGLLRRRWPVWTTLSLWTGALSSGFAYVVFADSRPIVLAALALVSGLAGVVAIPLLRSERSATPA